MFEISEFTVMLETGNRDTYVAAIPIFLRVYNPYTADKFY